MWEELGISGGTAIVLMVALYFVVKWAVRNGIKEAYQAIHSPKTSEPEDDESQAETDLE